MDLFRDIKVVRGLQVDLDNVVIRVISSMLAWSPVIRGGRPVNVRGIISVTVSPQKYKKIRNISKMFFSFFR